MSLWTLFYENSGKDVFKWVHYLPIYEKHFQRYIGRSMKLMEIGVHHGGSLQMWKRYLGPHVQIVGIDINPSAIQHAEDQINVRVGNQADPIFLKSVIEEFGPFDIIIDDGSHISDDQIITFNTLYDHVKEDGIYVVEDLHTNYWEEYGGGLYKPGTFIETTKLLIDELNAYHSRESLEVTRFTNSTSSIHFYDSMIFFEKEKLSPRRDLIIGNRDGQRIRQQKQFKAYRTIE